jgi:hypothetical protein
MGFGREERLLLLAAEVSGVDDDEEEAAAAAQSLLPDLPSYNEVMLRHRSVTVPQWREPGGSSEEARGGDAVHAVAESLRIVKEELGPAAENYRWDVIRARIRRPPLADLSRAAAVLRSMDGSNPMENPDGLAATTGFDWGSCAWRHCGALADLQEALDELDHLAGVLEPYEAAFCLDVAERSLRDILSAVDWDGSAAALLRPEDARFWRELPPYVPKGSAARPNGEANDETSLIDDGYLAAIQRFRID